MCVKKIIPFFVLLGWVCVLPAQNVLTLKQAIDIAVQNYPSIKAKNAYAKASQRLVEESKREYLPNVNFSAQNDFGTVNSNYGPSYGFNGLAVASSGAVFAKQNWNAAFGSLYLANINWDFFSFGKAKEKINAAQKLADEYAKDYAQEIFQHKIRVSAAYLNLVAAHQLTYSYQKNLARTDSVRQLVVRRAVTGLVAGIDSSQANAQYSGAKIMAIQALDNEEQLKHNLSLLLGVDTNLFDIDTAFVSRLPQLQTGYDYVPANHPVLQYYKSRIDANNEQIKYLKTQYYPTFTLVGVGQTRGSGFANDNATNPNDYTQSWWSGANPTRGNYLIGIGVTWNLTQPFRLSKTVAAQKWMTEGLQQEYDLANEQINTQIKIANDKMTNAVAVYNEAPMQITAAQDEYDRANTLYKNGLTNMVNVTQASYDLINAEVNKDIANNNIWQALLLKASATGDFGMFENNL